jgi:hypothetical protein
MTGTIKRSCKRRRINTLLPGKFESIPFSSKILSTTAVEEKENNTEKRIATGREKWKSRSTGIIKIVVISSCRTDIRIICLLTLRKVFKEISKPSVNNSNEMPTCESAKRLSKDGIKFLPTNPKITPLSKYPTTGGSLILLATNPPIKAATTRRIISLISDGCILKTSLGQLS